MPFPRRQTFWRQKKTSTLPSYNGIVHDEDEEVEVVIGSLRTSKITLDPDEFFEGSLWPR